MDKLFNSKGGLLALNWKAKGGYWWLTKKEISEFSCIEETL